MKTEKIEKSERLSVTVTMDKESYETVNELCKEVGQTFSWIIDVYIQSMAATVKTVRRVKGRRMTKLDLVRLVIAGAKDCPG